MFDLPTCDQMGVSYPIINLSICTFENTLVVLIQWIMLACLGFRDYVSYICIHIYISYITLWESLETNRPIQWNGAPHAERHQGRNGSGYHWTPQEMGKQEMELMLWRGGTKKLGIPHVYLGSLGTSQWKVDGDRHSPTKNGLLFGVMINQDWWEWHRRRKGWFSTEAGDFSRK